MVLLRIICLYKESNKWKKWRIIGDDHIWMPYSKYLGLVLQQTIFFEFNINMLINHLRHCTGMKASMCLQVSEWRCFHKNRKEQPDKDGKGRRPHLMSAAFIVQLSKYTWPSGYFRLLYHGLGLHRKEPLHLHLHQIRSFLLQDIWTWKACCCVCMNAAAGMSVRADRSLADPLLY